MTTEQESELLIALQALRSGDFSYQLSIDEPGIPQEIAENYNTIVGTLRQFNNEATRIFREVGSEGKFGGQAEVPAARGSWYNLILNLNAMSANLTGQVRDLSRSLHSSATGKPIRSLSVPVAGEMADLYHFAQVVIEQGAVK